MLKSLTKAICGMKYVAVIIINVPAIAQNAKGLMILGNRLAKKSFICQSRPRDSAPDSI